MKKNLGLYFIAIVPPSPVPEEVHELKAYFRDRYNSKASLRSPPHITLHMPFDWRADKEDILIDQLRAFAGSQSPVPVTLRNFGCFPPKVIFIHVDPSPELEKMQGSLHLFCKLNLNLFNARYRDLPYHPHLTVAFRDLRKNSFREAWKEFAERRYAGEFTASSIALLRHDGGRWQVLEEFRLGHLS